MCEIGQEDAEREQDRDYSVSIFRLPLRSAYARCDSGARHQTKFWSDEFLAKNGLSAKPEIIADLLKA